MILLEGRHYVFAFLFINGINNLKRLFTVFKICWFISLVILKTFSFIDLSDRLVWDLLRILNSFCALEVNWLLLLLYNWVHRFLLFLNYLILDLVFLFIFVNDLNSYLLRHAFVFKPWLSTLLNQLCNYLNPSNILLC